MRRTAIISVVVLLGLAACGDLDSGLREGDQAARQRQKQEQQRRQEKREEARKEAQREQQRQQEKRQEARKEAQREQRKKEKAAAASQDSSEEQQEECTPGYSPCLPPASDYDCEGGTGDGPEYTGQVEVTGPDPYDLDSDDDGIGCEP